jgi:hypothetical protein
LRNVAELKRLEVLRLYSTSREFFSRNVKYDENFKEFELKELDKSRLSMGKKIQT